MLVFGVSRSEWALCFSKYSSPFVCTYPDLCRNRRRHVRPLLYLDLNLNLYLYLYLYLCLSLNIFLFQKPFQKPFDVSFGPFIRFK